MEARRRSAISRGRCLRSVVFTVEVPALASEQGRKGPIGGNELVPDSCFDDAPLLEHDDPIGIAKRLEPVRDDKHGGAECSQSSDEAGLCERILVAGRLVEDEHATRQIRRRVKQRTGEGEALALPARETEPASPDDCPQVKIIELDECESAVQLRVGGVDIRETQVDGDRVVEHERILARDRHASRDVACAAYTGILPVNAHVPDIRIPVPLRKPRQGRFSRSGRTDNADELTSPDFQCHVTEHRSCGARIGVRDVVEFGERQTARDRR